MNLLNCKTSGEWDYWRCRLWVKCINVYGNHYYFIVEGLGANRIMMAVLGDGTYNTMHSVIGKIQRSYVEAAEANDLPSFRSATLIVTDASKLSLPNTPTRAIECTSATTLR